MIIPYQFKTVEHFVLHLESKAKALRNERAMLHPRTHRHAALGAAAAELESVVAIVRTSNLGIVC